MIITNTIRTKLDGTYNTVLNNQDPIRIIDHAMGFDRNFKCQVLDHIHDQTDHRRTVATEYIFNKKIRNNYFKFDFVFDVNAWYRENGIQNLQAFPISSKSTRSSFVCSFNNNPHISRKLLTDAMHYYGFFNAETCSKSFTSQPYEVIGTLYDLIGGRAEWYKKFFFSEQIPDFHGTRIVFGPMVSADHSRNQQHLRSKIDQSFLHIVSETMATSYYPFITEKFLYSVVQKGLFLAYAQPRWHQHLSHYYGFRRYTKIFNYDFDNIQNPVYRLIALMDMISKFSRLSLDDWKKLYEIEKENIEYNYKHYATGNYLKVLSKRVASMTEFNEHLQSKL